MLLSYPADCYFFVGYLRLAMLDRNFAHLNTTVGKHHQSWKNEETFCGDPGYNCRYFTFIHQNKVLVLPTWHQDMDLENQTPTWQHWSVCRLVILSSRPLNED